LLPQAAQLSSIFILVLVAFKLVSLQHPLRLRYQPRGLGDTPPESRLIRFDLTRVSLFAFPLLHCRFSSSRQRGTHYPEKICRGNFSTTAALAPGVE